MLFGAYNIVVHFADQYGISFVGALFILPLPLILGQLVLGNAERWFDYKRSLPRSIASYTLSTLSAMLLALSILELWALIVGGYNMNQSAVRGSIHTSCHICSLVADRRCLAAQAALAASLAAAVSRAIDGDWKVAQGPVAEAYVRENLSVVSQVATQLAEVERLTP